MSSLPGPKAQGSWPQLQLPQQLGYQRGRRPPSFEVCSSLIFFGRFAAHGLPDGISTSSADLGASPCTGLSSAQGNFILSHIAQHAACPACLSMLTGSGAGAG